MRMERGLSQARLGEMCGLSARTIQNYELGIRTPRNRAAVEAIAGALNVSVDDLLGTTELLLAEAQEKGGAGAARDINELVEEVSGLFAGGRLGGDALDGAMRALSDAYWIAKERNRKYTPKKYLDTAPDEG